MKSFSLLHPRDQIVSIMGRIYGHEMTTTSGGNISVRDEDGDVWITPARVDKGNLRRQDIVRIRPNGKQEGAHPPSSESPFHLSVYEVRPDLNAVIHAHPGLEDLVLVRDGKHTPDQKPSRAAGLHRGIYRAHPEIQAIVNALPLNGTAFCVSDFPLDTRTIPESYLFLKDVGKIPYERQFGDGEKVAAIVGSKNPVALLENNGVMVASRTVLDAFDRLEVLEATAAAIIRSRALGPISAMGPEVIQELLGAFPGL